MKLTLEKGQRLFFTSDTHYGHTNICRATTRWTDADNVTRDFKSLDHMNDTIVNIYANSTSTSKEEWQKMMDAETTITAKEAVKLGLVSDSSIKSKITNSLPAEWFFNSAPALSGWWAGLDHARATACLPTGPRPPEQCSGS